MSKPGFTATPYPGAIPKLMQLGISLFWLFLVLAVSLVALPARGEDHDRSPISQLMQGSRILPEKIAADLARAIASPTRDQQLPLFRAVMADPLHAPYRAGMLADSYAQKVASPHALMGLTGAVAGVRLVRSKEVTLNPIESRLKKSSDPLTSSLEWMSPMTMEGRAWSPTLPNDTQLPNPLRFELAMMLSAMSQSHQYLQRALAKLPSSATPELLRRQAFDNLFSPFEEPDYRQILGLVERGALLAGMLDLVAASERLKHFVATTSDLPALSWTLDTPLGQIIIDTTGQDNHYRLQAPLLVLDVGGNDSYEFLPTTEGHRISVLIDHQGNDHYFTVAPGADPSSATLGYGILWDTQGNDHYEGVQQAQSSALFGASLLVDEGGDNTFTASDHSQAQAIAGFAVLLSSPGNDQFNAQTHAQGSAGPQGVAVLIDPAGNDDYSLNNTPLSQPSPQLPTHNTSMGQGAGWGVRGEFDDGRSSAGGIGILLDLAGDDRYSGQVFAQGVGYYEGLGLLVDNAGDDHFDAAWYAMGAAAHTGAGILLKRGTGNDIYHSSHSISLGAAHDFSVGLFLDEGGNDRYEVAGLSLGAAHDNSFALFVDGSGNDHYQVTTDDCQAFGIARISQWGTMREDMVNLGLFMDLGGQDHYPKTCANVRNNANWNAPRKWPLLQLRSEAAAGYDGELPMPFDLRALTQAVPTDPP